MHDGFATIKDGYFVPHSHELMLCVQSGRWLLLPVSARSVEDAIAVAPAGSEAGPKLR
jgi:hypothetical protein